jgi:hypothetical protein
LQPRDESYKEIKRVRQWQWEEGRVEAFIIGNAKDKLFLTTLPELRSRRLFALQRTCGVKGK